MHTSQSTHCKYGKSDLKRITGIDVIRSIAIVCVIMCHVVVGEIYEFQVAYMQSISFCSRLFAFMVLTVGRLGVPFFLLITGYLMLDREYDEISCIKFWKNKILGLVIAAEIWILIYHVFLCVFNDCEFLLTTLIEEMLFLRSSSLNHMWYIPMILGMYLLLPIIANGLRFVGIKMIVVPYLVIFVGSFVVPTIGNFLQIIGITMGQTTIKDGFTGGTYGLYIIAGYLLKKGVLNKVKSIVLSIVAGISFIVAVYMQLYAYNHNVPYAIWYNNFFLLACGVCVFELILRVNKVVFQKVFNVIAKYSFAIYLVHNPINMILKRYIIMIDLKPLRVIFVCIITLIGSLIISFLIGKIPKVGKKIIYIR